MRRVILYPMMHAASLEYLRRNTQNSLDRIFRGDKFKSLRKEIMALIPQSMAFIDNLWDEFTAFLRTRQPVNRVYFEPVEEQNNVPFLTEESGLGRCLRYLGSTSAQFEKTQAPYLDSFEMFYRRFNSRDVFPDFQPLVSFGREAYLVHQVKRTLQDNETGLILYGNHHKKAISKRLQGFELEVYPMNNTINDLPHVKRMDELLKKL